MTNHSTMALEAFCQFDQAIITKEVDGKPWIVVDSQLREHLSFPEGAFDLLRSHQHRKDNRSGKGTMLVSERIFYQVALGSPSTGAGRFRSWVADTFLWSWYEHTGDAQAIYDAERLRHGPRSIHGEIETIVSEYLVPHDSCPQGRP